LSGSPQQGADDMMLQATVSGTTLTSVQTWTSAGNGWDKASDFNVQVFGDTVPDGGATLLLLGGALLIAGLLARRKQS
jgi:hypothetical protein